MVIVKIKIINDFDVQEVVDWINKHLTSFINFRIIELEWTVDRIDSDPWFEFEAEFDKESDATLFLLKWS